MSLEHLLAPIGGKDVRGASRASRQGHPSFRQLCPPPAPAGSPTALPQPTGPLSGLPANAPGCLVPREEASSKLSSTRAGRLGDMLGSEKLRQRREKAPQVVWVPWRTEGPINLFIQHALTKFPPYARQFGGEVHKTTVLVLCPSEMYHLEGKRNTKLSITIKCGHCCDKESPGSGTSLRMGTC